MELGIMNKELGVKKKIESFTDLDTWQLGHRLVLSVYTMTRSFPPAEQFGFISQMRRCAVSITSNIAEGFSRQSYNEKVQFYSIALGSTTELQNQVIIARDVGFLTSKDSPLIFEQAVRVHKILNGLIKGARGIAASKKPNS
jgi:four helix bundle protein